MCISQLLIHIYIYIYCIYIFTYFTIFILSETRDSRCLKSGRQLSSTSGVSCSQLLLSVLIENWLFFYCMQQISFPYPAETETQLRYLSCQAKGESGCPLSGAGSSIPHHADSIPNGVRNEHSPFQLSRWRGWSTSLASLLLGILSSIFPWTCMKYWNL